MRMKLPTLKRTIAGLLFGYIVTSVGSSFLMGSVTTSPVAELFPFFTWSLSSRVHKIRSEYIVEITNIDGEPIEPPRDMLDAQNLLGYDQNRAITHKAARKLGRARGGTPSLRRAFESRFMGRHTVSYRIVRVDYEPIERWRTGRVVARRILGEYRSGSSE